MRTRVVKNIKVKPASKTTSKKARRKIGILDGKGSIKFRKDFKLTEEEFSNSPETEYVKYSKKNA